MSANEIVSAEILAPMSAILRERYPELAIVRVLSNAIDNLLRRETGIAVRMVGRPRTRPWWSGGSAPSRSDGKRFAIISTARAGRAASKTSANTASSAST
jgi:DNA-binding transcriptional LysR family regulator